MSDDSYWMPIPKGMLPRHTEPGEFLEMPPDGKLVRILGQSTTMLKVRPARWWERLWMRMGHS